MRRPVIVSLSLALLSAVGSAAEEPTIIFSDGFETGSGCRWMPLRVNTPARGATVQGAFGDPVTVSGVAGNNLCTVSGLFVNGDPVTVAPSGGFSTTVAPDPGPNLLIFEATAESGAAVRRVQTFLYSTGYRLPDPGTPTGALVDPGMGLWLSQEFFDDGDHGIPVDDLATVAEMVLENLDYSQFYDPGTPIYTDPGTGYAVKITSLGAASASSSLSVISGGLHSSSALVDIAGDLLFQCTGGICVLWGLGDIGGGLTIDSVTVEGDLLISVTPSHEVSISVENVSTAVNGLDLSVDNPAINAILSLVEPIIVSGLVADLEAQLSTSLDSIIGPAVEDVLNSLILAYSFELDPLDVGGGGVQIDQHVGVSTVTFAAGTGADFKLQSTALPTATAITTANLGVPNRAGCGLGPQTMILPQAAPVEAGFADDNLNQQLYSSWLGGWLETALPTSTLDLGGYPVIGAEISVSAPLAPTISDCTGDWEMTLGDLEVYLSLTYSGVPIEAVAHASVTFEIDTATPGSSLEISFGTPVSAEFDLEIMPEAGEAFRAGLTAIIENFLLDGLAAALAVQRVGLFELPSVDVSSALGETPGTTVLNMSPSGDSHSGGNSVVSGSL